MTRKEVEVVLSQVNMMMMTVIISLILKTLRINLPYQIAFIALISKLLTVNILLITEF